MKVSRNIEKLTCPVPSKQFVATVSSKISGLFFFQKKTQEPLKYYLQFLRNDVSRLLQLINLLLL